MRVAATSADADRKERGGFLFFRQTIPSQFDDIAFVPRRLLVKQHRNLSRCKTRVGRAEHTADGSHHVRAMLY